MSATDSKNVKPKKDNNTTDENHGTGVGDGNDDAVSTRENHGTSEPAR